MHKADQVFWAHKFTSDDHAEDVARYKAKRREYSRQYDAVPEHRQRKKFMRQTQKARHAA